MKRFFANLGYWFIAISFLGLYCTLFFKSFGDMIWNNGYHLQYIVIIVFFYPTAICLTLMGLYLDGEYFSRSANDGHRVRKI